MIKSGLRLFRWYDKNIGLPPGTLVPEEELKSQSVRIGMFRYNPDQMQEKEITQRDFSECKKNDSIVWLNIDGLGDISLMQSVGDTFSLHDLVLEDICNINQRPKMEEHDDYLFFVLKMIYQVPGNSHIQSEQVSLILNKNTVLSFQEHHGDVFDIIRERIRKSGGRIRKMGADYLAYALMDAIVDNYFNVMANLAEEIEILENEVISDFSSETSAKIHAIRRKVILLRRSIWPLREVVNSLMRHESNFINETTVPFLRDLYDHTIQVIETLETFREVLAGLLDMYITIMSNRMNEVMKVLTIIATIFIPLSFIAGVYGMNFKYMPELELRWGYFGALGLMAATALTMILYFKIKKF
ncbi:MAG: magnesium/cobalt transporter CorA [Chitinivibrionales bacterium]|nr:magnesium/cobalt transporter CorA [Chitinivibrionales bacterium]